MKSSYMSLDDLANYWLYINDGNEEISEVGKKSLCVLYSKIEDQEFIMKAMEVTHRKFKNKESTEDKFKYFCGICWNKINNGTEIWEDYKEENFIKNKIIINFTENDTEEHF
jgi:hypothetical protein